jgi:hypothetical protein
MYPKTARSAEKSHVSKIHYYFICKYLHITLMWNNHDITGLRSIYGTHNFSSNIILRNKLDTHKINPVFCQPVKGLEEQQNCEQCHELWAEVISKNCKRQARLCHSIPRPLHQVL